MAPNHSTTVNYSWAPAGSPLWQDLIRAPSLHNEQPGFNNTKHPAPFALDPILLASSRPKTQVREVDSSEKLYQDIAPVPAGLMEQVLMEQASDSGDGGGDEYVGSHSSDVDNSHEHDGGKQDKSTWSSDHTEKADELMDGTVTDDRIYPSLFPSHAYRTDF